jgi:hypothetical protein
LLQVKGTVKTPTNPLRTDLSNLQLGKAGRYRCVAGGRSDQVSPNFNSVLVLDRDGDPATLKKELQQAQLKGHPAILRPSGSGGGKTLVQKTNSKEILRDFSFFVDKSDMRRFDPRTLHWAGMTHGTQKDFRRIAKKVQRSRPSMLVDESTDSLNLHGDELVDLVRSNATNGFYFHLMLSDRQDKPLLELVEDPGLKDRYPLFPEDRLDYTVLFIQPQMIGGTHIDDTEGASYFFLHLIEGRKLVRMWPFFEHGQLATWGCLQKTWHNATYPPEVFLRGSYDKGFNTEHWGPEGFEYGFETTDMFQSVDDDKVCQNAHINSSHVGRCFVEVEVAAGEEIFIPSGIPHQVTSLSPSVALS